MTTKQKAIKVYEQLKTLYPDSECTLYHDGDPWKLLVMARLSAQCTDARVNIVSKTLFEEIPDVYVMAKTPQERVEELIKSCGLYRTKAKSLIEMSKQLIENFDGKVPDDYDSLMSLSGVGSKIANLILGDVFGKGGIVADTHCIRITNRLGLVKGTNQSVVERTLSPIVPKELQSDFCHMIVDFGRDVCTARNPNCNECPMKENKLCKGN
ncbi:MAG: endonuclease III [Ruminococcaceae bacterium]|nr:endonuclease III [Oscillospiraceae bacterium]